jgi:hypothetical protein
MPTLNTNFTGSGIETTSPTAGGAYGGGGASLDLLGLSPELSQLLRTRIAMAQANANMGMRNAQNTEMRQGMNGVLGMSRGSLGAPAQDPALGRAQAMMKMQEQADQERRAADENAQARKMMLARQSQDTEAHARQYNPTQKYRLGGMLIDPKRGLDESAYMYQQGLGSEITPLGK